MVVSRSTWMKYWLYGALVVCLLIVSALAEVHPGLIVLMLPLALAANWLYIVNVSLQAGISIVKITIKDEQQVLLEHKNGEAHLCEPVAVYWNSKLLLVLKLKDAKGKSRWLTLFKDSLQTNDFRKLRAWLVSQTGF